MATDLQTLAELVRAALSTGDLEAYRDLLAPDAHWGPPGHPDWGCHTRDEVLSWYRSARQDGVAATVDEVAVGDGCILVGLTVTGRGAAPGGDGAVRRWQVLTVKDGRIADICGFDSREDAAAEARIPGSGC